jgi:hypothetical protein
MPSILVTYDVDRKVSLTEGRDTRILLVRKAQGFGFPFCISGELADNRYFPFSFLGLCANLILAFFLSALLFIVLSRFPAFRGKQDEPPLEGK